MTRDFLTVIGAKRCLGARPLDYVKNAERSEYFILMTVNGALSLNGINGPISVAKDELVFLPCSEVVSLQNASKTAAAFDIVFVSGEAAELFFKRVPPRVYRPSERSEVRELFAALRGLDGSVLPRDKALTEKFALNLMTELVLIRSEPKTVSDLPPHTAAAKKLLFEHPEHEWSLDLLAELTRTNKYTIIKDFKERLGVSPMRYLSELRLSLAKNLLLSTDLSVADISRRSGFSSANYFVHMFKKKTGLSPTEFRRSGRL